MTHCFNDKSPFRLCVLNAKIVLLGCALIVLQAVMLKVHAIAIIDKI